jgi:hypothetical protein
VAAPEDGSVLLRLRGNGDELDLGIARSAPERRGNTPSHL